MSAAVSSTVAVVTPGDDNTDTSESSDDSFSLKYHVSYCNCGCYNVFMHTYNYTCMLYMHMYMLVSLVHKATC